MDKKLDELLTEIESIPLDRWCYQQPSNASVLDGMPDDSYSASLKDWTLILPCIGSSLLVCTRYDHNYWEERPRFYGEYRVILEVDKDNKRVRGIRGRVARHRHDEIRKEKEAYEEQKKNEEAARKDRGYEGDLDGVLKKLK